MRLALGDGYVKAVREAWPRVPETVDFVMYWASHATELVAKGKVSRLGFITTNSITQTFNRPVLQSALDAASQTHYGAPCGTIGQGGTIPLMSLLQQSFPAAQMMVCGVLGPKSNAHGPNEFLHVPYGKKLTAAVAQVMAACP